MCEVDNQGRCAKHNLEWKSFLEVCPLCAMSTGRTNGSKSMAFVPAVSPSDDQTRRRVSFKDTAGGEVGNEHQFTLPSNSNLQFIDASVRSVVSISSAQSGDSSAQRSTLKSPKYKSCPKKFKEQSNVEVTAMSMEFEIREHSEGEDATPQQQQSFHLPQMPTTRILSPPPRSQSRHKEEKSNVNPRKIGKSPVRSLLNSSINSLEENTNTQPIRPDPEELKQNSVVCVEIQDPPVGHFANCSGPSIMTRNVAYNESAISFMDSHNSTTQSNFNVNALSPFQEMDVEPQDKNQKDFDYGYNDDDIFTSTNNYDSIGRCVKHPHIRLRRKKFFGQGWKILMSACPDCCVDELRRMKSESSTMKSNDALKPRMPLKKAMPRNGITDKDSDDTASLSTSSQKSINMEHIISVVKKEDQDGIFVENMKWTDLKGRRGFYTGAVDSQFIPNGQGSMQYEDATLREGEWKNGGYKPTGRSRSKSSERSSRSRSVSILPGARSRSASLAPHTRSRSSSRAR